MKDCCKFSLTQKGDGESPEYIIFRRKTAETKPTFVQKLRKIIQVSAYTVFTLKW